VKLVLFGAPGCGKGTQAKELKDKYQLDIISLGDILRQEVQKKSELGQQVQGYMAKGALVPDEIVAKVLEVNLADDNFVLEGYPRTYEQALHLDKILKKRNLDLDYFIYLDVSAQTVVNRLQLRRVCRKCGAIFHLKNMPPKVEDRCDYCSGELMQRDDDKPQVIRQRLEVFNKQSNPIVDFYKDKGKLFAVDANAEKDEVFARIVRYLDKE
jgi:adenylate kinase